MQTVLLGLLAHPAGHSLSPRMHGAALAEAGLDGLYLPFDVPPSGLRDAVRGLVALGFAGANVTIPHKVAVLDLVDEISPQAEAAGSANTLVFQGERGARRVTAHNTDAPGFLAAWEARFGAHSLHGAQVVLLGCGGAARAVVLALAQSGVARLTVLNRDMARGRRFIHDLQGVLPSSLERPALLPLEDDVFADCLGDGCVVIQATSVGMAPHAEETPVAWPANRILEGVRALDLVYAPRPTRFLREARAAGCQGGGRPGDAGGAGSPGLLPLDGPRPLATGHARSPSAQGE